MTTVNKEPEIIERSTQALSYAKRVLRDLHDNEIYILAERLDVVMSEEAKKFIAEIRK